MFAPNLRRKIFGWLERVKNSAGIRLSHKNIRRRRGACVKIRRGGWRRRLRGLGFIAESNLLTFESNFQFQWEWDPDGYWIESRFYFACDCNLQVGLGESSFFTVEYSSTRRGMSVSKSIYIRRGGAKEQVTAPCHTNNVSQLIIVCAMHDVTHYVIVVTRRSGRTRYGGRDCVPELICVVPPAQG